jgi:hypothetical protein
MMERTLGFRLVGPEDVPRGLPYATAAALALPEPDGGRS